MKKVVNTLLEQVDLVTKRVRRKISKFDLHCYPIIINIEPREDMKRMKWQISDDDNKYCLCA